MVTLNRTSDSGFLARRSMSSPTLHLCDPVSCSNCSEVWAAYIGARPSKNNQMRSVAGRPSDQLPLFFPKIIKIAPIVSCHVAVVFQTVGITLGPLLNLLISPIPVDGHLFGEQFKMDLVADASAVKPEEKDDRSF